MASQHVKADAPRCGRSSPFGHRTIWASLGVKNEENFVKHGRHSDTCQIYYLLHFKLTVHMIV